MVIDGITRYYYATVPTTYLRGNSYTHELDLSQHSHPDRPCAHQYIQSAEHAHRRDKLQQTHPAGSRDRT